MTSSHLQGFFAGVGLTIVATSGLLSLSGFQGASLKIGSVDAAKAANDSIEAKRLDSELQKSVAARQGLLEFISTYPTISAADATRFRELSLKPTPTAADTAEIERLRNAVIAEEKKSRDLQTKASPTAVDLSAIEGYRARAVATRDLLGKWSQEFDAQLYGMRDKSRQDLVEKVRSVIAEVGKKGGYTVIYDSNAAPYSANDISDEVKKALDRR
ncbi:MAG: hypothetical protein C4320_07015 [Armatimonadota bacterium]